MSDVLDDAMAARCAALQRDFGPADWLEVRRRARPRRGWIVAPLAAALTLAVAGFAFALERDVVPFLSSEPAPRRAVVDFGRMQVAALGGLGPDVVPEEARVVWRQVVVGRERALFVAPTTRGGFCYAWDELFGSCGRNGGQSPDLGYAGIENTVVGGFVLHREAERLELRYEDGQETPVPLRWVSPPIDAGFFLLEIPETHRAVGRRAAELVVVDASGGDIARHVFKYTDPAWETAPDGLPRVADRSRKKVVIEFSDATGRKWSLVTAPAPGGRLCYAYNMGGGCLSPELELPPVNVGPQNAGRVAILGGQVAPEVATVELLFEDGAHEILRPTDRFVLWEIPAHHYPRGHRLELVVGRDADGREVGRRVVATDARGFYPCEKPVDLGYGAEVCP